MQALEGGVRVTDFASLLIANVSAVRGATTACRKARSRRRSAPDLWPGSYDSTRAAIDVLMAARAECSCVATCLRVCSQMS